MIRTTHAEIGMLRKGAARTLRLPSRAPAEGAKRGKAPVRVDQTYTAYAPANGDRGRQDLRVTVTAMERDGDGWLVTVRGGLRAEEPLFLAARPSALGKPGQEAAGDPTAPEARGYTTDPARALNDEPECIPAKLQEQYARESEAVNYARRAAHLHNGQEERELLALHERLRELEAQRGHADISRELRSIRQRIERAENRSKR